MILAVSWGLKVHVAHLDPDILGFYSPEENCIYLSLRLTPEERLETLAHELGHAFHGHTCDSEANERQADAFAAQTLIDPDDYARAEALAYDQASIASELGVSIGLVKSFQDHCIQRIGNRTYGKIGRRRLTV